MKRMGFLSGIIIFSLMLGACSVSPASGGRLVDAQSDPYDAFLFVKHVKEGDGFVEKLVLGRVLPDKFELREILSQPNFGMSWQPLCVRGGVAYGLADNTLLAINLSDGRCNPLRLDVGSGGETAWACNAGWLCVFKRGPHRDSVLELYDFERRVGREMTVEAKPRLPMALDPIIAVAPDMKTMATFDYQWSQTHNAALGRAIMHQDGFRLKTIDLKTGKVTNPTTGTVGFVVRALTSSLPTSGPPLAWIDARTIVFVHSVDPEIGLMEGCGPNTRNVISTIDVMKGTTREIATIPCDAGWASLDHIQLIQERPGTLPIVQCMKGIYQIDLQGCRLIASDAATPLTPASGGFRVVKQERGAEQMFFCNTPLGGAGIWNRYQVSPDGRRLIWHQITPGKTYNPMMRPQFKVRALNYYDAEEGKIRTVTQGCFATPYASGVHPISGIFWFSAKDLEKVSKKQAIPAGWQSFEKLETNVWARIKQLLASQ